MKRTIKIDRTMKIMTSNHPKGIVKQVNEDKIIVIFSRSSACGKCEACGLLKETGEMFIEFPKKEDVSIGDIVNVEVEEKFFLLSALLLYGVPLLGLIVGITLGTLIFGDNLQSISAILGISLAVISYFILKIFDKKFEKMKLRYMSYSTVDNK